METDAGAAREGLHAVTRGTLLMLVGSVGYVLVTFLARVLLTRSFSPTDWGEYSLALAVSGLLATIGSLGLPQAVARSLPYSASDSERRGIVRTGLFVSIASASTVAVGLFLFGAALERAFGAPQLGFTVELFAVAVGFSILSAFFASVFQGYEDVLPNALYVNLLNPVLFFALLVAGFHLTAPSLDYTDAVVAYVLANGVLLAILVTYARRRLPRRLPAGPRAPGVARRLLWFTAPLFIVGVMGFITGNADTLILGVIERGQVNLVGYYTASLALSRLVQVGIGSLSYIFLPVASRFVRQDDHNAVRLTYATATKWMALVSLPLLLIFSFLPSAALGFVYGPVYTSNTLPLRILILGAFASTVVGPAPAAQVAFGQTRLLMYNTVISGTSDVVLAIVLIPPFGVAGAAVAWAFSNALNPILSAIELSVLVRVHPFQLHYLVPVVLTGLPLAALLVLVPWTPSLWLLPVVTLAIAGAYLLIVFLTGSIDRGDRLVLEAVEGILGRPLTALRRLGDWRLRRGWVLVRG